MFIWGNGIINVNAVWLTIFPVPRKSYKLGTEGYKQPDSNLYNVPHTFRNLEI